MPAKVLTSRDCPLGESVTSDTRGLWSAPPPEGMLLWVLVTTVMPAIKAEAPEATAAETLAL